MPVAASTSRSSFDKARKKLMPGNRNSTDRDNDSQNGHKRTDSLLSDETKQTTASYNDAPPEVKLFVSHLSVSYFSFVLVQENAAMLNEFDNLMRSNSTMKVSLTPDRLKTMEVCHQ